MLSPQGKLGLARKAFREGNYDALVSLLEGIANDLRAKDDKSEALELLGTGYFFEAQNAKTVDQRNILIDRTKDAFWLLLQEDPDHHLDEFLFPASIVEVFTDVLTEHKSELDALKKTKTENDGSPGVLYIERNVERKIWAINLMPFGMGQFQNEQPVKGTLFAVVQTLSLGINIASFLTIESLRNSDNGRFSTEPDGGDFAQALLWRNIMWVSLGVFVASYAGSVWDGINFFQETKVRIRTLDEAPLELSLPNKTSRDKSLTGSVFSLPIGLSYSWTF